VECNARRLRQLHVEINAHCFVEIALVHRVDTVTIARLLDHDLDILHSVVGCGFVRSRCGFVEADPQVVSSVPMDRDVAAPRLNRNV